jgi:putative Mg2+ transporter-C (MgtC) family protein
MLAVDLLVRVGLATVLGVAIGFERQWRSRIAGLQTMALVSMGSSLFLILSAYSFNHEANRLVVAAQIVSGIGFLGAGVIMKQGLSVTGLNTAATLWSTAAVGALAGAWMWREAIAGATIVVAGNWFLQPLANRMDRRRHNTSDGHEAMSADYILEVVCHREMEAEVKALVAGVMPAPKFQLRSVRARAAHGAEHVDLQAGYAAAARNDRVAEEAVRTLSQRPGVTSAQWSIADEQAADWSR